MPDERKNDQLPAFISALFIALGYVSYVAAGQKVWGLVLFACASATTLALSVPAKKYLFTLTAATLLLALTPFSTKVSPRFIIILSMMIGAVVLVYAVSRYLEHQHLVHLALDWHRKWQLWEIIYTGAMVSVVYLVMPYYFKTTDAIHAWYFERHPSEIIAVFACTMAIGIWEEFFFTATVLGVLRKYLPFFLANTLQAIMFGGFLYGLGFRYWAPLCLFGYGWAQGYVFNKTQSLLFVLVVHICVDLLVCLVLLHAYYPDLVPIFLTS